MQLEKHSKVIGVTFAEADGTKRQDNCRKVVEGQKLYVMLEKDNPFDPNAMKVFIDEQMTMPIGYIQRELASDLQTQIAQHGWSYEFFADKLTGGSAGKSLGVNIRIVATKQ